MSQGKLVAARTMTILVGSSSWPVAPVTPIHMGNKHARQEHLLSSYLITTSEDSHQQTQLKFNNYIFLLLNYHWLNLFLW